MYADVLVEYSAKMVDQTFTYIIPLALASKLKRGMKVKEIPVVMRSRQGGVSSINPKKSIYYMIKVSLAIVLERLRRC